MTLVVAVDFSLLRSSTTSALIPSCLYSSNTFWTFFTTTGSSEIFSHFEQRQMFHQCDYVQ